MGIAHGIILLCKYMWFGMPAAHQRHQNVVKHIKAVQELLEGIFDDDLDSVEGTNIEHFVGIKDDSSDAF